MSFSHCVTNKPYLQDKNAHLPCWLFFLFDVDGRQKVRGIIHINLVDISQNVYWIFMHRFTDTFLMQQSFRVFNPFCYVNHAGDVLSRWTSNPPESLPQILSKQHEIPSPNQLASLNGRFSSFQLWLAKIVISRDRCVPKIRNRNKSCKRNNIQSSKLGVECVQPSGELLKFACTSIYCSLHFELKFIFKFTKKLIQAL